MLERTVTLFDLESTGLGFKQGIVEIAYASFTIGDLVNGNMPEVKSHLINPGCEISKEASDVHGITEEMIMFEPKIEALWSEGIAKAFGSSYYAAGYNSEKFDVPLLNANLERAGIEKDELINNPHLDVMKIYKRISGARKGTLGDVCELYGVELKSAHRAAGDVQATIELLAAMIREHGIEEVLEDKATSNLPDDALEAARRYREVKLEIEAKTRELNALKGILMEAMGDDDKVDTPYLTIELKPGRMNINYKKLIDDLGLNSDEIVPYQKQSAPSRTIRLK